MFKKFLKVNNKRFGELRNYFQSNKKFNKIGK